MSDLLGIVGLILRIGFPLLCYAALRELGVVGGLLVVALAWATRRWGGKSQFSTDIPTLKVGEIALVIALVGAIYGSDRGARLYPVVINATFYFTFAHSLRHPPPIVERFARRRVPDLSLEEKNYCRRVTLVWCAFFLANGGTALATSLFSSLETWAIYTGVVAYLLIGTLGLTEFLYRHWRFRRYVGSPFDPVVKLLFPEAPR